MYEDWINPVRSSRVFGDQSDKSKDKLRFYISTRLFIEFDSNLNLVLQTDGT